MKGRRRFLFFVSSLLLLFCLLLIAGSTLLQEHKNMRILEFAVALGIIVSVVGMVVALEVMKQ